MLRSCTRPLVFIASPVAPWAAKVTRKNTAIDNV
jgi:hypothetical protein